MLGLSPIIVLAADYSLPLVTLLFLPLFAIHRGGSAAIAKEHQALHDALTGLPNRVLFRDRVEQALHAARRSGRGCAVMLMDLDHFKEINDTLGHHQGDRLLQEVAARLRGALRAGDTVARLGGDEFAILLHGGTDPAARRPSPSTLLRAPARAVRRRRRRRSQVGGSIGIACCPEHGTDVETLMQRADIAMYAAKAHVRRLRGLSSRARTTTAARRLALAGDAAPARSSAASCVLALPAEGRPARPAGSSASRRSRAGSIPSSAWSSRRSSCRSPSRPA